MSERGPEYVCDCKFGCARPNEVVFDEFLHDLDCPFHERIASNESIKLGWRDVYDGEAVKIVRNVCVCCARRRWAYTPLFPLFHEEILSRKPILLPTSTTTTTKHVLNVVHDVLNVWKSSTRGFLDVRGTAR